MRASATKNGLTVRAIAGVNSVIIGIDLQESRRAGCLGFSIERTEFLPGVASPKPSWLPNMLRFKSDGGNGNVTTQTAPLQKFRWGDYTTHPGTRYRYRVVPRYGKPGALEPAGAKLTAATAGVAVDVTTEDNTAEHTAVFFNRAAAASHAFQVKFKELDPERDEKTGKVAPEAKEARAWLSRGLEEALIAFMRRAKDSSFALHAAIYEFQKPELLAELAAAHKRKATVEVVYHARQKAPVRNKKTQKLEQKDHTVTRNMEAMKNAGIEALCTGRDADPQGAIMHNKFVVLLKKGANGKFQPQAVWTGSTNWTDGGIYGQLNVGHAVYEPEVAAVYEELFQVLQQDLSAEESRHAVADLTPVPMSVPAGHVTQPIFSPQMDEGMLSLYADICARAKLLMVCAPFELFHGIRKTFSGRDPGTLHYLLIDKPGSLGKAEDVEVIQGDAANSIGVAVTLSSPLHDFQKRLLEGSESFHHKGVHIHAKIILADPFSNDPVLVTGSANFSHNSTSVNDSNSLLITGDTAVADVYTTEFMRMFEHYHFRGRRAEEVAKAKKAGKKALDQPMTLSDDDSWSEKYYVQGSNEFFDRRAFAGTMG